MSMHLHHPSLSLNGKKKGKHKFRNAEEARQARELAESWKNLQTRWGVDPTAKKTKKTNSSTKWTDPILSYRGSNDPRPKSVDTGWVPCTKNPEKVYTGSAVLGISTLHKSNAVPVFSREEAIDISKMRR